MQSNNLKETLKYWRPMIQRYQRSDTKKALFQVLNSFLPFLGLWVLMYFSLNWSYWLTFGLAIIAAWFLVRIFIIQHDCGHQSFLKSRKLNNAIGFISSLFSTIPYKYWSRTHAAHHAHNGQLEYRGLGDIHFLTTEEFRNRSRWGKLSYWIFRSPIVQFLIAPIVYLTVSLRYPSCTPKGMEEDSLGLFYKQFNGCHSLRRACYRFRLAEVLIDSHPHFAVLRDDRLLVLLYSTPA